MDKDEFKEFCHAEFIKHGFQKKRSMYYRDGNDGIQCGIWLKKSSYGSTYGVMILYFIDQSTMTSKYPSHTEYDLIGYIEVMSKITDKGKHFLTGSIDYELYTKEELTPYFEKAFNEFILPSVNVGKPFLVAHIDSFRTHHTKTKEDIIHKLLSIDNGQM